MIERISFDETRISRQLGITVRRIELMAAYDIAKELLRRADPTAVFRRQPAVDWQGEFPLPSAVAEYFTELGPVDVWIRAYSNPYFLPSLSELWEHQTGYRTHGLTHERLFTSDLWKWRKAVDLHYLPEGTHSIAPSPF
jgi:hypothetical protein